MATIDLDARTLAAALWTPARVSPLVRASSPMHSSYANKGDVRLWLTLLKKSRR